jgi:inorganic pyrophosphatase
MWFYSESTITSRGSIDYNRAAGQVRYNVTSDRRLKSNIHDSESALSTLDQIKVRSYTWTETGYGVEYGFVAQELNEVAPDAVKVGDDGDEVVDTWAVDNAKLVPLLTKALQEALQKIDAMETRLAALEAA